MFSENTVMYRNFHPLIGDTYPKRVPRLHIKVQRNAPCPCGCGKKAKQCNNLTKEQDEEIQNISK